MSLPASFGKNPTTTEVRIGCCGGFFGDSPQAAHQLVHQCEPPLHYLVSDYLAEVTMGILARRSRAAKSSKKPAAGYIDEVMPLLFIPLLSSLADNGTRVVINAGALDPLGLKRALEEEIKKQGLEDSHKVAAVYGDDLYEGWEERVRSPSVKAFSHLNVGSGPSVEALPGASKKSKLLSLNAYIGAMPIVMALKRGATIVVTGRIVDSAMVVAPLIYEFGWTPESVKGGMQAYLDKVATASLAGHIIECGAQATGGNFTDWRDGALSGHGGWSNMGYGIVHFPRHTDGNDFYVTKPPETGGVVSRLSVGEQVLYEVLDPENYILPDVVLDLSNIRMEQAGPELVRVSGAKGRPPPTHLKCTAILTRGYKIQGELAIIGEEAKLKAEYLGRAILERARRVMDMRGFADFTETRIEVVGTEVMFGANSRASHAREVYLRISASHEDPKALFWVGMEMAQSATSTAPAITGAGSGRARPAPLFSTSSILLERSALTIKISVGTEAEMSYVHDAKGCLPYHETAGGPSSRRNYAALAEKSSVGKELSKVPSGKIAHSVSHMAVPLIRVAVGRSGDKGNSANIAFIARKHEFYHVLLDQITPEVVRGYLDHLLTPPDETTGEGGSEIVRYEVPGIDAVNFVVTKCLGGGGLLGLQLDRQAKSFAQIGLSAVQVRVPYGSLSSL